MKKTFNSLLTVILFSLFAFNTLFAQRAALKADISRDQNGYPRFIDFSKQSSQPSAAEALNFLKSELKLDARQELRQTASETDAQGITHITYRQYFSNIPVEHGIFKMHVKKGGVSSINGDFKVVAPTAAQKPAISSADALRLAKVASGAKEYTFEAAARSGQPVAPPQGELVYKTIERSADRALNGKAVLVYKFNLVASGEPIHDNVYIHAGNGSTVAKLTKVCNGAHRHEHGEGTLATGTAETRFSGTRSIETTPNFIGPFIFGHNLRDNTRGGGIEAINSSTGSTYLDFDNFWSAAEFHNANKDDAALDALWGAEMTYDYFLYNHGRNSFDNAGAKIDMYININENNAYYWNGTLTFGRGDGVTFDAFTGLDVVAHEFGHGVCQYTAGLEYSYESGALNEAFSDIWGVCVEAAAAPEKDTWLLGEDAYIAAGQAFRSLANPNLFGQPDTYKGTNWYTGDWDNGGVHINSGVLNHWFYLLCVGGEGTNDKGNKFVVNGIGMQKAAQIVYNTEAYRLTATSQYTDVCYAALAAAGDMFGYRSNEYIQTQNAFYAVGLIQPYQNEQYCFVEGNTYWEWIESVSAGTIYNVSGDNLGYLNATNQKTAVRKGENLWLTLTPGFRFGAYEESWRVWIDYNQDEDFDDAGETIDVPSSTGTISTWFAIPETAKNGPTRLRIGMRYAGDGKPAACDANGYGETEDYTIVIQDRYCNGDLPINFTSFEWIESAMVGYTEFNNSGNNYGYANFGHITGSVNLGNQVSIYAQAGYSGASYLEDWRVFIDGNQDGDFDDAGELVLSVDDATYIWNLVDLPANTLPGATTVRIVMGFNVSDDACQSYVEGEIEDYTLIVNNSYCAPSPVNTVYEYINSVYLNDLGNVSGDNGGYADFPWLSAKLNAGGYYYISMEPGFKYGPYNENWNVFIDFNQDGDFDDASEWVGAASGSGWVSFGFSVPSDAQPGKTRMRVVMSFGASTGACPSGIEGEVEDYRVIVDNVAMRPAGVKERAEEDLNQLAENNRQREQNAAAGTQLQVSAFPNPSNGIFTVEGNWTDATRVHISILSATGQTVRNIQHDNPAETQVRIDLGDMPDGVYFLRVSTDKAQTTRQLVKSGK